MACHKVCTGVSSIQTEIPVFRNEVLGRVMDLNPHYSGTMSSGATNSVAVKARRRGKECTLQKASLSIYTQRLFCVQLVYVP